MIRTAAPARAIHPVAQTIHPVAQAIHPVAQTLNPQSQTLMTLLVYTRPFLYPVP